LQNIKSAKICGKIYENLRENQRKSAGKIQEISRRFTQMEYTQIYTDLGNSMESGFDYKIKNKRKSAKKINNYRKSLEKYIILKKITTTHLHNFISLLKFSFY
jgi:hydrogenase maturation factor HypE